MRHDKEKAFELRRAGKSYRNIQKELGVSLSTLSAWFKEELWSQEIGVSLTSQHIERSKIRIKELHKIRGDALAQMYEESRSDARKSYFILKEDPLFIGGLVAYWGEGDKASRYACRVSNTDPGIIKLYMDFLVNICNIPSKKIKAYLLLYPDLNERDVKSYWSNQLKLPLNQFANVVWIKGRHKTKRTMNGICSLHITSRYLKEKMLVWLELFSKEILTAGMV